MSGWAPTEREEEVGGGVALDEAADKGKGEGEGEGEWEEEPGADEWK